MTGSPASAAASWLPVGLRLVPWYRQGLQRRLSCIHLTDVLADKSQALPIYAMLRPALHVIRSRWACERERCREVVTCGEHVISDVVWKGVATIAPSTVTRSNSHLSMRPTTHADGFHHGSAVPSPSDGQRGPGLGKRERGVSRDIRRGKQPTKRPKPAAMSRTVDGMKSKKRHSPALTTDRIMRVLHKTESRQVL